MEILKRNVALETVLNRAARALGNLAMDPEGSALIHSTGESDRSARLTASILSHHDSFAASAELTMLQSDRPSCSVSREFKGSAHLKSSVER